MLALLLALCGGCTGYNYYDPYGYYLIDEYIYDKPHNYRTANKQRQQDHKELIKKLDRINKELEQQTFDARQDRLLEGIDWGRWSY